MALTSKLFCSPSYSLKDKIVIDSIAPYLSYNGLLAHSIGVASTALAIYYMSRLYVNDSHDKLRNLVLEASLLHDIAKDPSVYSWSGNMPYEYYHGVAGAQKINDEWIKIKEFFWSDIYDLMSVVGRHVIIGSDTESYMDLFRHILTARLPGLDDKFDTLYVYDGKMHVIIPGINSNRYRYVATVILRIADNMVLYGNPSPIVERQADIVYRYGTENGKEVAHRDGLLKTLFKFRAIVGFDFLNIEHAVIANATYFLREYEKMNNKENHL